MAKKADFTIHELEEKASLICIAGSFRLVPECIVFASQNFLEKGDLEKSLRYLENAFYVYRETVNKGFFAPHIRAGEAYEWPQPSDFSWEDADKVISLGEYLHGPIPSHQKEVIIKSQEKGMLKTVHLDIETGNKKEILREIITEKDNPEKTIKYHVCDLRNLGFLFQQEWQNQSLNTYANPIYYALEEMLRGEKTQEEAKSLLIQVLKIIEKSYPAQIGVIAGKNQKPDTMGLFL